MDLAELTREEIINHYWTHVQQTVRQYGDKEFIVTSTGTITYRQANQRANVIYLALREVTKNRIGWGVALFMKEHCSYAPSIMGVLKSRNFFTALDVNFPESTLRYMLETAEIKVILTVDRYVDQARSLAGDAIIVVNIDELNYDQEIEDPVVSYSPEDVAQILSTSGSTGQPKGAIADYQYIGRSVYVKVSTHTYSPDERSLHLSTYTYAGPYVLFYTALIVGYTICYYDVQENGLTGLPDWIHQQRITDYHSTTTLLRGLFSILKPGETFPSVKTFHFGAEKSLEKDVRDLKKFFPSIERIRLLFSSTETQCVASTMFPIDYDFGQENLTSGYPQPDLKVYIWDENGKPLPQGEAGEIVVYGDALVRGYINNPELTHQRFIQDLDHPGWQYYKTGDLGKFRPDGQLVHLGRIDNMVKIRGIRIETQSIESHMLSYPGIVQVASRAFEDQNGNKRLASYFVAEDGVHIPISDLRKHLAERLPSHQLPHYFIELKKIPLTKSGKISIGQLPPPKMVRPSLANDYVPASDELEKRLVAIWEEQIGVSGIGVTDDFFEVGGDSLIGALIFAAIEASLGKNLPVSTLLKAPTIRDQAELIRAGNDARAYSPVIPINTDGDRAPLFFIPGKGGYPTRIRHLAKMLELRTPIYALQDLIVDPSRGTMRSIPSIASFFVDEIRKLYPHGPYILVGESMGGKIAYEVAQQLTAIGERVSILALLDTYNLQDLPSGSLQKRGLPYYGMLMKKHLRILVKSDWQGKKEYLLFYAEISLQKLGRFFGRDADEAREKPALALPEALAKMEDENRQIAREYKTLPYSGRVILFKAMRGSYSQDQSNGWEQVALGELVIQPLDCYHGSILFEPAVSRVAEVIQGYIEKESV
jgi:acyl-coenzyme A synthetase/AMP-(fatty) acid ligase/thioesterase domain-containing protein